MEYIKSPNREQYIRELAGLSFNIPRMIKDPNKKIKNFADATVGIIILDVLMVILSTPAIWNLIKKPSLSLILFLVFIAFVLLVTAIAVIAFYMRKAAWMKAPTDSLYIDCDEEGVTHHSATQQITVNWSSIKCIKTFKYSMIFVPVNVSTQAFMAPIENLDNFKSFIEDHGIEVPIVGND